MRQNGKSSAPGFGLATAAAGALGVEAATGWLRPQPSAGLRKQKKLGQADDVLMADGKTVLTCEQAKAAARAWAKGLRAGAPQNAGLTVNDVLDRYFEARQAEGMKSIYDARSRAKTPHTSCAWFVSCS